jgi:hypothetical protein
VGSLPRAWSRSKLLAATGILVKSSTLAACWLTSSFDGLTRGTGDASPIGDGPVAMEGDVVAVDAGRDAVEDASSDAVTGVEASADASPTDASASDTPVETAVDAAVETGVDAGSDTGADTGSLYRATVLGDTPLAYWRFGESSGTLALDEVMANPPATYLPTVTLKQLGALVGDPNTAVLLDGDAGCVSAVSTTSLAFPQTSPITIEAWIKPAAAADGSYRHVYTQETTDGNGKEGYGLFVESGGLTFQRHVSDTAVSLNVMPPQPGVFTYVVATYDGSALHLYVNGAEPLPSMPDARPMPVIPSGAQVGCGGGLVPFHGTLDEVAVYGKALGVVQVSAHYQVGSGI